MKRTLCVASLSVLGVLACNGAPNSADRAQRAENGRSAPHGDDAPSSDPGEQGEDESPEGSNDAGTDASDAGHVDDGDVGGDAAGDAGACPAAPQGWRGMASATAPENTRFTNAAWSGTEMFVLGSYTTCATGGCTDHPLVRAYDPVKDSWRALGEPPFPYGDFIFATFAEGRWVLFGANGTGVTTNEDTLRGYTFDPKTESWAALPLPPVTPRTWGVVTYAPATHELVLFGGAYRASDGSGYVERTDGAAYSFVTGTWRAIADAPFSATVSTRAVWNADRVLVPFPTYTPTAGEGVFPRSLAATYDPVTDTWASLAAPPGTPRVGESLLSNGEVAFAYRGFPAYEDGDYPDVAGGVSFDAKTSAWTSTGDPAGESFHRDTHSDAAAWSANGKFYVWGGYTVDGLSSGAVTIDYPREGGVWDPATKSWTSIPASGPSGRAGAVVVYTGCDAIVYGGSGKTGLSNDGGRYRP